MPNKTVTRVHQPHRTYALAFKQQIIRETLEPGTSVSVVARRHDINANVVFEWRRQYRSGKLSLSEPAAAETSAPMNTKLLPVLVIDTPTTSSDVAQIAPRETAAATPAATACCEVEIEVGKRRVRIRGLSMERTELFLRDCLR